MILLLTRSVWAFFFEFQQNSKMATNMASARPHSKTTNTPPEKNKYCIRMIKQQKQ